MDLNDLPVFAMMNRRMAWLTRRQQVLAQNIANSDTPGYRPHDLVKLKFRDMLGRAEHGLEMRRTSAAHLDATRRPQPFRDQKQKETYETEPNGNAVVIEEQLMKVSETQGAYRLATNLYRKHVNMFRIALGRDR